VYCQTVINIISKTVHYYANKKYLKTKSQKLITRCDSLTLLFHVHVSHAYMYKMIPGFLKDMKTHFCNHYSCASGNNGTITDTYFCQRFLFFYVRCLHLLRFPLVSCSLLKMNICYTWNWIPRLGLMPCLWFRLLWTKLTQHHAFKIFIPIKHYIIWSLTYQSQCLVLKLEINMSPVDKGSKLSEVKVVPD
jgi:hypothetical protein